MIYLIGGAPRSGKSTLCQQFARQNGFGWISTDLVKELMREASVKLPDRWDANPDAITHTCDVFLPYLERFMKGVASMAENYVIEGVDFLPGQIGALDERIELSAVFLGRSRMTLEQVNQFPGKSPGYAALPEALRRQIANDVPAWSDWIAAQANDSGYPYVDMALGDFASRLEEASAVLVR